jgi:hypothetical protein
MRVVARSRPFILAERGEPAFEINGMRTPLYLKFSFGIVQNFCFAW